MGVRRHRAPAVNAASATMGPSMLSSGLRRQPVGVPLTDNEIARYHRDGFLAVKRPLASGDELVVVRRLLDSLFGRFGDLPRDVAYDLGDVQVHDGPQQIAEINDVLRLEPRLRATAAFERCRDLASQLLGGQARCTFDHAILKPPHNQSATEWHQDLASSPSLADRDAVHIWLALHDVERGQRLHAVRSVRRSPGSAAAPPPRTPRTRW